MSRTWLGVECKVYLLYLLTPPPPPHLSSLSLRWPCAVCCGICTASQFYVQPPLLFTAWSNAYSEIVPEVTLQPLATSCAKDYKGHLLVQTSFTEPPNTGTMQCVLAFFLLQSSAEWGASQWWVPSQTTWCSLQTDPVLWGQCRTGSHLHREWTSTLAVASWSTRAYQSRRCPTKTRSRCCRICPANIKLGHGAPLHLVMGAPPSPLPSPANIKLGHGPLSSLLSIRHPFLHLARSIWPPPPLLVPVCVCVCVGGGGVVLVLLLYNCISLYGHVWYSQQTKGIIVLSLVL